MDKNRNLIIGVVLVLILAGLACWYYEKKVEGDYSVVYLVTGEVYVGKLKTFHGLELRDAYILLVTQDPADKTKNNFQLNPVAEALWAPEVMYLSRKNVVFHGPLLPESEIAKTLAAQEQKQAAVPAE